MISNILFKANQAVFIDFEMVRHTDVFVDLGTIIASALVMNLEYSEELFTEEDQNVLLNEYFGRVLTDREQTHLTLMVIARSLCCGAYFLDKAENENMKQEGLRFMTVAFELFKTVPCYRQ